MGCRVTAKYPSKTYLWLAQLRACFYCRSFRDRKLMTLDHFIPRSRVGKGIYWHRKRWNIVLACKPCNQWKGDRMPTKEQKRMYQLLFDRDPPTVESLKSQIPVDS